MLKAGCGNHRKRALPQRTLSCNLAKKAEQSARKSEKHHRGSCALRPKNAGSPDPDSTCRSGKEMAKGLHPKQLAAIQSSTVWTGRQVSSACQVCLGICAGAYAANRWVTSASLHNPPFVQKEPVGGMPTRKLMVALSYFVSLMVFEPRPLQIPGSFLDLAVEQAIAPNRGVKIGSRTPNPDVGFPSNQDEKGTFPQIDQPHPRGRFLN